MPLKRDNPKVLSLGLSNWRSHANAAIVKIAYLIEFVNAKWVI